MTTELEEVSSEIEKEKDAQGDPKKRVHVLVYERDWDRLGELYGSAVKRGNVIRMLLRDFLRRLESKAEQKL